MTNDRGEGLLLRPVYGDDVQSVQADLEQLQVCAVVVPHVFKFQSFPREDNHALAASLAEEKLPL